MDSGPCRGSSCGGRSVSGVPGAFRFPADRYSFLRDTDDKGSNEPQVASSALSRFHALRAVLELLEDFSVLSDILSLVVKSGPSSVLGSVADTLLLHRDIFAALGTLQQSFASLLERYQVLKARKLADKIFARAMAECASVLPGAQMTVRQLWADFRELERGSAAAAYSPVSDDMPDDSHLSDLEFFDDIERLLSSGTSVDPPTLARLFQKIVTRIQASWDSREAKSINFGLLLLKLRLLNASYFDKSMENWVHGALRMYQSPRLFQELSSMVVAGCLSFKTVVLASAKILDATSEGHTGSAEVALAIGVFEFVAIGSETTQHCSDQVRDIDPSLLAALTMA